MATSLFGQGGGVNVNANGTLLTQSFIGTGGQTVFNIIGVTYTPGTNSLIVFINGQRQVIVRDFNETTNSSFTLIYGVIAGDFVDIILFPETTLNATTPGSVILGGTYSLAQYIADSAINVKQYPFLAKGDGVTDDTAAINLALTAAANKALYFPAGTYKVSNNINIANPCILFGDFHNTKIVTNSTVNNIFTIASNYVRIIAINFDSSVIRTAGWFIDNPGYVQIFIVDCEFNNWINGVRNNGTTFTIQGCQFYNGTAGTGVGIRIDNGFDISIKDVIMSMPVQIFAGIYITQTGDTSIDDCQIIQCGQSLYLNPGAGQVIASVWANNCFFDTGVRGLFVTAAAAGSAIVRCLFDQCWFSSGSAGGIHLGTAGVGNINGIDFNGCHIINNFGNGITINDSNVTDFHIDACVITGSVASGIGIAADVNTFSITNSRIGAAYGFGGNNIGIFITGGTSAHYIISDNNLIGNVASPMTDGGTGVNRVIHDNPDYDNGRAVYDPPNLADGAGVTTAVGVFGATLGDFATAAFSLDTQGIMLTAWVSAGSVVSVRFQNETGGPIDLASGVLRVSISRKS